MAPKRARDLSPLPEPPAKVTVHGTRDRRVPTSELPIRTKLHTGLGVRQSGTSVDRSSPPSMPMPTFESYNVPLRPIASAAVSLKDHGEDEACAQNSEIVSDEGESETSSTWSTRNALLHQSRPGRSAKPRYQTEKDHCMARIRENWNGGLAHQVEDILGQQYFGERILRKVYQGLAALSSRTLGDVDTAREMLDRVVKSGNRKDSILTKSDVYAAHKLLDQENGKEGTPQSAARPRKWRKRGESQAARVAV